MNDWKSLLRDADRSRDAVLPADDVNRIRTIVMSAASQSSQRQPMAWSRAFVITATLLILICTSVIARLQRSAHEWQAKENEMVRTEMPGELEGERQQLQFTSPGGTRIIWVFDPRFEVKGSLP